MNERSLLSGTVGAVGFPCLGLLAGATAAEALLFGLVPGFVLGWFWREVLAMRWWWS